MHHTNDLLILFLINVITLIYLLQIYGIQKQKQRDEMQKSLRPHIKADHQWY